MAETRECWVCMGSGSDDDNYDACDKCDGSGRLPVVAEED